MVRWFSHFVAVRVEGLNQARLLNSIAQSGAAIYSLRVESGRAVSFFVRYKDRKKLFANIDEKCYNVTVTEERSFRTAGKALLRRSGLAIGLLAAVAAATSYSAFVWSVDIEGANLTGSAALTETLSESGVRTGVLKSRLDIDGVIASLESLPTVSQASVSFKGTKLKVFLAETLDYEPETDLESRRDIMSGADGIVLEILVLSGKALVEKGQAVKLGQVLIEGTVDNQAGEFLRETRAMGRVKVVTHYKAEAVFFTSEVKPARTGKTHVAQEILLFGKPYFGVSATKPPFSGYESETEETPLFYGQMLPFVLRRTVFYECEPKEYVYDYEERRSETENKLIAELLTGNLSVNITDRHSVVQELSGGYRMKLYLTAESTFE